MGKRQVWVWSIFSFPLMMILYLYPLEAAWHCLSTYHFRIRNQEKGQVYTEWTSWLAGSYNVLDNLLRLALYSTRRAKKKKRDRTCALSTHPIFRAFSSCTCTYSTRLQRFSCLYRQLKRVKLRKRGIRYLFHIHFQFLSLVGPKPSPFKPPPFLTNILFDFFFFFFYWSWDWLHTDCPLANRKAQEILSEARMRYRKIIWNP